MTKRPTTALRTTALLALGALALGTAPALAEAPARHNTFQLLEKRAPLPGERAAGDAQGAPLLPGDDTALAMQGNTAGGTPGEQRAFAMIGRAADGAYGSRRSERYLGDGVSIYDNDAFRPGYYSGFGYGGTPRLAYNQSFLNYMYRGNIAGVPSVGAPLDFWRK